MIINELLELIAGTEANLQLAIERIIDKIVVLDAVDDFGIEQLYTALSVRLKELSMSDPKEKLALRKRGRIVLIILNNKHSSRNPYNPFIAEMLYNIPRPAFPCNH